jgi:hypothetical protein
MGIKFKMQNAKLKIMGFLYFEFLILHFKLEFV